MLSYNPLTQWGSRQTTEKVKHRQTRTALSMWYNLGQVPQSSCNWQLWLGVLFISSSVINKYLSHKSPFPLRVTFKFSLMTNTHRSWSACRPGRSGDDSTGTCQTCLGNQPSSTEWPETPWQEETHDGGDGGKRVGFQRRTNPKVSGTTPQQLFCYS